MSRMSPAVAGAGFMLAATVCYSTENAIVKIAAGNLTVWQIGFGRYLLGAVILFLLFRRSVPRLLGQERRLLIFQAVLSTFMYILFILSIQMLPLSLALILFFIFPAFTALFSPWICGERVSAVEWGAVAAAVSGTVIILWPAEMGSVLGWGYLVVLTGSVLAGVSNNLLRRLGATDSAATIYFYRCFIGAPICLPFLLLQPQPLVPTPLSLVGLVVMASFALLGELSMNRSFKMVSSTRGGILLMSELVIGASFGIIFLGEPASPRLIAGAGLILGCGVVLTLRPGSGPAVRVPAEAKD